MTTVRCLEYPSFNKRHKWSQLDLKVMVEELPLEITKTNKDFLKKLRNGAMDNSQLIEDGTCFTLFEYLCKSMCRLDLFGHVNFLEGFVERGKLTTRFEFSLGLMSIVVKYLVNKKWDPHIRLTSDDHDIMTIPYFDIIQMPDVDIEKELWAVMDTKTYNPQKQGTYIKWLYAHLPKSFAYIYDIRQDTPSPKIRLVKPFVRVIQFGRIPGNAIVFLDDVLLTVCRLKKILEKTVERQRRYNLQYFYFDFKYLNHALSYYGFNLDNVELVTTVVDEKEPNSWCYVIGPSGENFLPAECCLFRICKELCKMSNENNLMGMTDCFETYNQMLITNQVLPYMVRYWSPEVRKNLPNASSFKDYLYKRPTKIPKKRREQPESSSVKMEEYTSKDGKYDVCKEALLKLPGECKGFTMQFLRNHSRFCLLLHEQGHCEKGKFCYAEKMKVEGKGFRCEDNDEVWKRRIEFAMSEDMRSRNSMNYFNSHPNDAIQLWVPTPEEKENMEREKEEKEKESTRKPKVPLHKMADNVAATAQKAIKDLDAKWAAQNVDLGIKPSELTCQLFEPDVAPEPEFAAMVEARKADLRAELEVIKSRITTPPKRSSSAASASPKTENGVPKNSPGPSKRAEVAQPKVQPSAQAKPVANGEGQAKPVPSQVVKPKAQANQEGQPKAKASKAQPVAKPDAQPKPQPAGNQKAKPKSKAQTVGNGEGQANQKAQPGPPSQVVEPKPQAKPSEKAKPDAQPKTQPVAYQKVKSKSKVSVANKGVQVNTFRIVQAEPKAQPGAQQPQASQVGEPKALPEGASQPEAKKGEAKPDPNQKIQPSAQNSGADQVANPQAEPLADQEAADQEANPEVPEGADQQAQPEDPEAEPDDQPEADQEGDPEVPEGADQEAQLEEGDPEAHPEAGNQAPNANQRFHSPLRSALIHPDDDMNVVYNKMFYFVEREFRKQIRALQKEVKWGVKKMEADQNSLEKQKNEIKELKDQLEMKDQEKQTMKNRLEGDIKRITAKKTRVEDSFEIYKTQKMMEDPESKIKENNGKMEKVLRASEAVKGELRMKEKEIVNLQKVIQNKDARIESLKEENSTLADQIDSNPKLMASLLAQEKMKGELAQCQMEITHRDEKIQLLENSLQRADGHHASMKSRLMRFEGIQKEKERILEMKEILEDFSEPSVKAGVKRIEYLSKLLEKSRKDETIWNHAHRKLLAYDKVEDKERWKDVQIAHKEYDEARAKKIQMENDIALAIEEIKVNPSHYFLMSNCHTNPPKIVPFGEKTASRMDEIHGRIDEVGALFF
uniref:PD-(D/E)XK nuclease superfamily protein n=1 Tax=Caenorhabditis tropicalis TaxID=1561998 RepID=A0A1I7U512_9PELO